MLRDNTGALASRWAISFLATAGTLVSAAYADEHQGSADSGSLEAIVVTAQRRAERIQDVPFTVTAQTGRDLQQAGITDSQSLSLITSGVVMGNGGANAQPAIRGISSYGTGPGEAANVAMYLDGVYQPMQKVNFFDLNDIDRVEILKGPQGTLFGANATGGAIRIFTREPTATTTGNVEMGYGNYDSSRSSIFLGGPLVENVLLGSIAGSYTGQDGYSKDLIRGGQFGRYKSELVRAKLKYVGSDWFEAELTELQFDRSDPNAYAGSVLNDNTIGRVVDPNAIYGKRPWETAQNQVGYGSDKGNQTSLHLKADFGRTTLTSITAYENSENGVISDIDYSSVPLAIVGLNEKNHTLTEELQLSSNNSGPLNWVAGYFFYNNRTDDHEQINPDTPGVSNIYVHQRARTHAVFGELTYQITDDFSAIVGARYSHEWTSASYGEVTPIVAELGHKSWNSATPRVSLKYRVTPDTNVYATFSKGFKSGLFGGFDKATVPVDPEKVTAYEVGVKTQINHVADLNVAAYYYDYKDQQFSQYNGLFFVYKNAASSKIYGIEADGAYHILSNLDVRFGASYNHANYENFPDAPAQVPSPTGGNMSEIPPPDLSGDPMARAPRKSGNLGLNYAQRIGAATVNTSVNAYVSDKYYFEPSYRIVQPGYVKLNAQLELKPADDSHLTFRVWGKNLTQVAVKEAAIIISTGDFINYSPPRTYGVSVGYQF